MLPCFSNNKIEYHLIISVPTPSVSHKTMSIIHMENVKLERNTQEKRISVCPVIPNMYTFAH